MATNPRSSDTLSRRIGYDLLGPVVHRWLLGLHQYVNYFDDGETEFLYCARAGLRIQRLYELFLSGYPQQARTKGQMFWISRVAVCKGTYKRFPKPALNQISLEYTNLPMSNVVRGLLRHSPKRLRGLNLDRRELKAQGREFPDWLETSIAEAKAVKAYLSECGPAFDSYVEGLLAGKSRAVLIDSGWQGSAQSMLARTFPKIDWQGVYFGRILTPSHDPSIVRNVIGILFEEDAYEPEVPESAFILHRHIIETLLEPNGPSIEEIPGGSFKQVADKLIKANLEEVIDKDKDAFYLLVRQYLEEHAGSAFSDIVKRHQVAMEELARIIVVPTRQEARALRVKHRSADFGKALDVPVLLESDHPVHKDPDARIANALWTQGQIALEFNGGMAREMQLRSTNSASAASYFDPQAFDDKTDEADADKPAIPRKPVVAIITRTKNRPLLLKRAAESVARQTYDGYVWVVVNDGGDEADVREVIEESAVDRRKIILVSNAKSLGMEAASNVGIRNSDSDFILIHDDDDSLHENFLQETVSFLTGPGGKRYGGVITHSVYVSEEIRGNQIIEHARVPYRDWVRNVQLAEMVCENFFPPISFIYRRSLWEAVGGYNESLPVLGDWYFNLEFLLHSDIAVIQKPLAYYHHRDRGEATRSSLYTNSVIGGVSKHEEFGSVVRNEFFRKNSTKNPAALAILLGYTTNEIRNQSRQIRTNTGMPAHSSTPDRLWAIACINKALSGGTKTWRLRLRGASPLSPDASWEAVQKTLFKGSIEIPIPEDFDEARYLATNEDVAAARQRGEIRSGYEHYLKFGWRENRERPRKNA